MCQETLLLGRSGFAKSRYGFWVKNWREARNAGECNSANVVQRTPTNHGGKEGSFSGLSANCAQMEPGCANRFREFPQSKRVDRPELRIHLSSKRGPSKRTRGHSNLIDNGLILSKSY